MRIPMLWRFSAYGFLKNQRYYEPFLLLALLGKPGVTFTVYGFLIGFRELAVNVMEVPTGVIADLAGRRRSMILSFAAYIIAFLIFGLGDAVWQLFPAMFFFAVGEAFRTGTHKAMILDWLRLEGRESEKTRTYGYTRSWSKIGSALAAVIAAGLVFYRGRYSDIFLFSIVPYVLGIVNFLGYPAELDGRPEDTPSVKNLLRHMGRAFRQVFGDGRLRRVFVESMSYQGTFKAVKDYVQPTLRQLALALPVLAMLKGTQRTAIVVGGVYLVIYLVEAGASRHSYRVAGLFRGESRAARALWVGTLGVFLPITVALWFGVHGLAAAGFVVLYVLFNLWRPIAIARIDNETKATMGATMLSIESQSHALVTMVLAPLLGYGVERLAAAETQPALWVVGVVGVAVALLFSLLPTMKPHARPGDQGAGVHQ